MGIRSTNLPAQYAIDELLANVTDEGVMKTARVPIASLASQLAGTGSFVFGNMVYVATRAQLLAITPATETTGGVVLNDSTASYNGYYSRVAAAWVRQRGFPDSFAEITVTGGTGNAVTAASAAGVDPSEVAVFFIEPTSSNSGAVTLSVNGASALPVVDINGDALTAGLFTAGRMVLLANKDTEYRLLSDPDADGAAAAAAASAAEAEAWALAAALVAVPDGSIDETKLDAGVVADINAGKVFAANFLTPGGRLTLTADTPFPAADVSGATTIYYEAASNNAVPVHDGTVWTPLVIGSGVSLALDADTGHTGYQVSANIYDLFAFDSGSDVLAIGTGPSWSAGAVAGSVTNGNSYRGTGAGSTELEMYQGVLVNKNAITLRFGASSGDTVAVAARQATYLGSFEPTADGQASDSATKRCLYNAFNQTLRLISLQIAGGSSYNYSTATWRQVEGDGNFFAKILFGLAGGALDVEFSALVSNSTTTPQFVNVGIDLTGTTPEPLSRIGGASCTSTIYGQPVARYVGSPGIGRHAIIPLEKGAGAETQTWLEPVTGTRQTGLLGNILL